MAARDGCQKIQVAHVVLQLDMGGMEKLLVEFGRHVDRRRFDLRFVSLTTRGPVADEIEALGWPTHALQTPPGLRVGLVFQLARLFKEWDVDVVHAHNSKPLLYCSAACRLGRRGRRLVYTRHGQRHGARARQNFLYRLAARRADAIVCVSKDSAERCVNEGLRAEAIHTVWNGIDLARFECVGPAEHGPAVMVGRLSPEKDVETLLRAMAIIKEREPGFRLEVAGDGACLPELRESAGRLGLNDVVRFLGSVSDVPGLLRRSSVSVLSSVTEGISLTLLEAMSRGLPVVATRVGGNPEVVADGETGILVPPKEPAVLAEQILRVWRDPEMGRRMGLAARRRVEEHFDVRRMVANYEQLYEAELRPRVGVEACAATVRV